MAGSDATAHPARQLRPDEASSEISAIVGGLRAGRVTGRTRQVTEQHLLEELHRGVDLLVVVVLAFCQGVEQQAAGNRHGKAGHDASGGRVRPGCLERRCDRRNPVFDDPLQERLLVEVIRAVEARERSLAAAMTGTPEEAGQRLWEHVRSPQLAAQERLFFEVYGQALQGREWAKPLLDGVVEDWITPVAAAFEAAGTDTATARIVARLSVAVTRGLLLDALAKGEDHDNQEVDAAMQFFQQMLFAYLSAEARDRARS